jgi:hypothetical protein
VVTLKLAALLGGLALCASTVAFPANLVIPRGTVVFGELGERVTSSSRRFSVGQKVDGHVWKDIIVNGRIVIPAGTPIELRIADIDASGTGGRGGSLAVMAVSVKAIDGTEIFLDGGYNQSGGDRYGLTRASFVPGRRAVLDEGTVFDASIPADTRINVPDTVIPTLNLTKLSDFTVEILYDEIDQREGSIPLELTLCNSEFVQRANVTAVNEKSIRPIVVTIITREMLNGCYVYTARVNLAELSDHFEKGINRFTVMMGEAETSVILNVEM